MADTGNDLYDIAQALKREGFGIRQCDESRVPKYLLYPLAGDADVVKATIVQGDVSTSVLVEDGDDVALHELAFRHDDPVSRERCMRVLRETVAALPEPPASRMAELARAVETLVHLDPDGAAAVIAGLLDEHVAQSEVDGVLDFLRDVAVELDPDAASGQRAGRRP